MLIAKYQVPLLDAAALTQAPFKFTVWPRTFTADGSDMAIFQPQISTWKGNQLAREVRRRGTPTGSKDEAYGVVSFTARTEIDKPNRMVTLRRFILSRRAVRFIMSPPATFMVRHRNMSTLDIHRATWERSLQQGGASW
jgi:hypothetical protein